jgi:hypothetical protein
MRDGTEIVTNMHTKIKNIREFPPDWIIVIMYLIYKGKRTERKQDAIERYHFHPSPVKYCGMYTRC